MKFAKFFAAFLAAAIAFGCFAACSPDKDDNNEKGDDPVYYTVTFDLDGGEVTGKDLSQGVKVEKGTQLALENYTPEKLNFTFKGWLSGETEYAANAQITVNSDIALKALWELIPVEKFTVTFDPAGGTLNGSAERLTFQAEKDTALDFSQYIPERDKYTFKGWKTGETLYNGGTYTVTSATNFVATWAKTPSADENFQFEETEEKDGYILKSLAANSTITEIVLPGYYQNKPVLKIANYAFSNKSHITAVDLSNCDKLEEIGDWNFYDCSALASVNLEGCSSLKKIGGSCFSSKWEAGETSALTEINLKGLSALEEIGTQCFRGNGFNGSAICMPVEKLDFSDCVSLRTIGEQSFWYLDAKEIDLSGTKLVDLERKTITYCQKIEKITLPKTLNLTTDSTETFGECENLKEIILDPLNIFMTVEDGALMDADKTVIYKYAVKSDATNFTAPETVKTVMNWAFYKATNLTEIDFSATKLTEIKNSAFAGCTNALLKVPFGEDGTYADKSAACTLGSNWKDGVKEIQYGEGEKIFKFTTDLVDGQSVTEANFNFTASAEYGSSYELADCALTVKFNGSEITGEEGSYTVTLQDGENTIELIASSGDDTEMKTYKVNKVGKAEIKTDLSGPNAKGEVTFKVWTESGSGERQDLDGMVLKITVAYGSTTSFSDPSVGGLSGWVTSSYNSTDKCFEVTVDFDALFNYMYEDYHVLKIEITGSACDPYITGKLNYA